MDKDLKKEVDGDIEFETVVAGETTTKQLYMYNSTNYHLNITLNLDGDNISISKDVKGIAPAGIERVEFEFTPQITIMQPIKAKLNIKINYIVQ